MEDVVPFPRVLNNPPPADAGVSASPTGPGEVGLYGLGHYTLPILEYCRDAGIRVAFVVDNCPEAHPAPPPAACLRTLRELLAAWPVPLWTNAEFCERLERRTPSPPLVASSILNRLDGSVSTDPYLRAARLIREVSGGSRTLLHPVVLAHVLRPPPYRKRVTLFGFPGAGNILAKHLLAELWGRIDLSPPPSVERAAAFAEHYYVSTAILAHHVLRDLTPVGLELTPLEFPTLDLSLALPGDEYARVRHVPCNLHLSSFFNHTHGIPTGPAVDEWTRLGTFCVAVVRHPCETILSWASKFMRPPTPVLDRAGFFRETALQLASWHRQLIDNEDRFLILRYEDLAARRRRPLRALAERLGVCLRSQEIDSLYGRFLNRNLEPTVTPGHFYRGGSDKWKRYFLRRHMCQLRDAGVDRIFQRWGYDLTPSEMSTSATPRDQGKPSGQTRLPLNLLYGLQDRLDVLEPFPLVIHSNSRAIGESIRAALHGPEFLEHLNAGGLGPASPSWVPPIPWGTLWPIFHPESVAADTDGPASLPFEKAA